MTTSTSPTSATAPTGPSDASAPPATQSASAPNGSASASAATQGQTAVVRAALQRGHVHAHLGPLHLRAERRGAVIQLLLVIGILVLGVAGLLIGDYAITVPDALGAVFGTRSFEDPLVAYFVNDVRLPRVVGGVLVGFALGCSGAVFQLLSGNPLGSPDIIGFTRGSATGALIAIIVLGGSTLVVAAGAVIGGLLTAVIVYAIAYNGGVPGGRLVLVGIGIGAILAAVNTLLVAKADLGAAQKAQQWMAGSLNATLWPEAGLLALALAILLPVVAAQFRTMTLMPLGDELAVGLGTRVERSRLILVVAGVLLMAVAVAAAGPVAFVALAAPHLYRTLARTSGVGLVGAGVTGAFLVSACDLIARRIFAPDEIAVGVVTGSLGGIYLVIILFLEWRKRP